MRSTIFLTVLVLSSLVTSYDLMAEFRWMVVVGLLMLLDLAELAAKDRTPKVSNVINQADAE